MYVLFANTDFYQSHDFLLDINIQKVILLMDLNKCKLYDRENPFKPIADFIYFINQLYVLKNLSYRRKKI